MTESFKLIEEVDNSVFDNCAIYNEVVSHCYSIESDYSGFLALTNRRVFVYEEKTNHYLEKSFPTRDIGEIYRWLSKRENQPSVLNIKFAGGSELDISYPSWLNISPLYTILVTNLNQLKGSGV